MFGEKDNTQTVAPSTTADPFARQRSRMKAALGRRCQLAATQHSGSEALLVIHTNKHQNSLPHTTYILGSSTLSAEQHTECAAKQGCRLGPLQKKMQVSQCAL